VRGEVIATEGAARTLGDRYRIVRELGRGGMGVVYLGRDLRRDMDVAIKSCTGAYDDAALWLKREFRSVAALRHPHLVELYELVAHERGFYFTMEYLRGIDPRRHVAGDVALARAAIAQLADGVAFLHARGVIHRDVKPSNVLVDARGHAKLLDFGLALDRRRAARVEQEIVGTAAYLSPEYLDSQLVSPAMDVFALGVVAFELVTGAPPFGGTLHVLQRLGRDVTVPRASSVNAKVPADLDALIAEMLAIDPARRPSADEVLARLYGDRATRPPQRREPRFVGRDRELGRLDAALAGATSRLVLVCGASGAGKSALVDAVLAKLPDALIWRGRCDERERVPYRAFDSIIDDLATELVAAPQLADGIEHAAALARVFPTIAAALDAAGDPVGDLRVERERALHALVELFRELIPFGGRVVLAIDDLQWADDDSRELVALLVEGIARRFTIVATWTCDGAPPPAARALLERLGDAADSFELGAMRDDELAALIGELAPDASPAHVAAAVRRAAGSPYLADLIGRELGDRRDDGDADSGTAEARRLARLDATEREVANIVALATSAIGFDELRAVAELAPARLVSALRGLADQRVVRALPATAGDPVYAFYHQRLRDVSHAAITPDARRVLHRRFAEQLRTSGAADRLAHHHHEAGDDALAARAAIAAAESARAQLAWNVAAEWYARALAWSERAAPGGAVSAGAASEPSIAPSIDRDAARAGRADALALAGDHAAAARAFEELGGDAWQVRAAEAYVKLGELERGLAILDGVLARRGEPRARSRTASVARAAAVATRWLTSRGPRGARARDDDVLAAAYRVIASFLSTPYPIESLEYVLRLAAVAEARGDRDARATGLAMIGAYLAAGSLGRYGDRAIARAHELADGAYPRMVVAGCAGILAMLRGEWAAMRARHEAGERACKELGLERSWEASFLKSYWALGEYYAGEPRRALALLDGIAAAGDDLFVRALIGSYRGRAFVAIGELDAARALVAQLDRAPAARYGLASVYRQLLAGELALATRDSARAGAICDELARSARAQWLTAMPAIAVMIDVLAAEVALGRGDTSRARRLAGRIARRGRRSFYAAIARDLERRAGGDA
jgi:hypothetical protein